VLAHPQPEQDEDSRPRARAGARDPVYVA
jgi:hypothetical protein